MAARPRASTAVLGSKKNGRVPISTRPRFLVTVLCNTFLLLRLHTCFREQGHTLLR